MLYNEYIKQALKETLSIYGPDAIGHMEEFRSFFEDSTLLAAINGDQILFSSAGNIPTNNIRQALVASGINKYGQLPIGRCFLTNVLEDSNLQDVIEDSLNIQMESLVSKMRGGKGQYGIVQYLMENPKSDPNAFEMVDVITAYNNLIAFGKSPPENIKDDIDYMFSHRKQNFIENGIGTDSAAYRICEFCYNYINSTEYPLPAVTIAAMRKIASLDLYIRQQMRDNGPLFDNVSEVEVTKNYFAASNNLKPGFLDEFKDDLESIYNIAKENRERSHEKDQK